MEEAAQNNKALSVSEAMALAKSALEACTVTLIGEVSEISNKPGYKAVYFSVKDEQATLPAMMWMNRFHAAQVDLRVGMLVQLTGRFSLYAAKGRMNFDVFSLSLAGEGDLRQKVANLAKKLQSEGLMEAGRKRPIPEYPKRIGLVTSPRGAAVHDVLRTLRRRYPSAEVLLAGVPVEGANAAAGIVEGLKAVFATDAELVLLVRGGGSFEDLMPFNDEALARCIAASPIPVVTGIGHEPDTCIADMVADYRASTPTAAAEYATPNSYDLLSSFAQMEAQMYRTIASKLEQGSTHLHSLATRPVLSDARGLFAGEAQTLDLCFERLQRAIPFGFQQDTQTLQMAAQRMASLKTTALEGYIHRLQTNAARLEDLSPLTILGRGFSLAKNSQGALIKSIDAVQKGEPIQITVADGSIDCRVENTSLANRDIVSWKENA